MELTAEILQRVVNADQVRFGARSSEKRQSPRLPLGVPILVESLSGDSPNLRVRARDISKSGIGLLCARPMELGMLILLRLPQHGGKPIEIQCKVVRCEDVGDGLYVVGATFEEVWEAKMARVSMKSGECCGGRGPDAAGPGVSEEKGHQGVDSGQQVESREEYIRRRRAVRKGDGSTVGD